MEYNRRKRKQEIEFQHDVVEKGEPKKPDKEAIINTKTPSLQLLSRPDYAVSTGKQSPAGYAVTPDRYSALLQTSEDEQSPQKLKRRKIVDSADILSGVRPIAPATKVCETVAPYRPLQFKNGDLAKKVIDLILGEETREKYKK